jgi:prepilin-type N-terminal cleavage/methylation domain-containing protein
MKFFRDSINTKAGFTLVELMVVVGIVGVLARIATVRYQSYAARARLTEAKVALGNGYAAMHSYYAENSTFTGCLNNAGFSMDSNQRRYFTIGYGTIAVNVCGPNGGASCMGFAWTAAGATSATCAAAEGQSYFTRNAFFTIAIGAATTELSSISAISKDSFVIGAYGDPGANVVSMPSMIPTAYADGELSKPMFVGLSSDGSFSCKGSDEDCQHFRRPLNDSAGPRTRERLRGASLFATSDL